MNSVRRDRDFLLNPNRGTLIRRVVRFRDEPALVHDPDEPRTAREVGKYVGRYALERSLVFGIVGLRRRFFVDDANDRRAKCPFFVAGLPAAYEDDWPALISARGAPEFLSALVGDPCVKDAAMVCPAQTIAAIA